VFVENVHIVVENVHIVNDEQRVLDRVGGVVRLKAFDEAADLGICDSLLFFLRIGQRCLYRQAPCRK
jgi:hypothetical protein